MLIDAINELRRLAKSDESFESDLKRLVQIYNDAVRSSVVNEFRSAFKTQGLPSEINDIAQMVCSRLEPDAISIHGTAQCRILEEMSACEHEQWMAWSKSLAEEVSKDRLERWKKLWISYQLLPEDQKDLDRVWARKAWAGAYKYIGQLVREAESRFWIMVNEAIVLMEDSRFTQQDKEDFADSIFQYVFMARRLGGDSQDEN